MNKEPNYFAVIPGEVRYSDLPANAKLLYGEITALSNKEGYCWATNTYFAQLYGVSKISVSRWVSSLVEKGFIKIELLNKQNSKEVLRKLYIPHNKIVKGGINKNVKGNNTSINNTNNTITKVIGGTTYGNVDINTVMDDLYTGIGLKPVNVKAQRIAASNLIKRHGLENTRKLIKIALQLQETDTYASRITSMQDLWNKQNNILVSIKKNHDNQNNNQIRSV
jgi:hypothetical protein